MSERDLTLSSLVPGMALGVVVGFPFAPQAGEDTRSELGRRLRKLGALAEGAAGKHRGRVGGPPEDELDA